METNILRPSPALATTPPNAPEFSPGCCGIHTLSSGFTNSARSILGTLPDTRLRFSTTFWVAVEVRLRYANGAGFSEKHGQCQSGRTDRRITRRGPGPHLTLDEARRHVRELC